MHKKSFDQHAKPHMRYFDAFEVTCAAKYYKNPGWLDVQHWTNAYGWKDNVHFKSPVLDEQLNVLFDSMLRQGARKYHTKSF